MINILTASKCCGCSACLQICPQKCISFTTDQEGFQYPQVDKEKCVDCGLCEKVCPELHQFKPNPSPHVYAAINNLTDIRLQSSSGGFFSAIAQNIIDEGGFVFGARFDTSWNVIHSYVNQKDELHYFRGSKYVQSNINDSYIQAKNLLKSGKKVLFTGTPCQILAFKNFLFKDYPNLITAEVICHGVPSPLVWRKYLNALKNKLTSDDSYQYAFINFRDKKYGWTNFSQTFVLESGQDKEKLYHSEPINENLFMRGFLRHLYLRPSCHQCPAKGFVSDSDFTIGDFWGYQDPTDHLTMKKGISLVIANNSKAEDLLKTLDITCEPYDRQDIIKSNFALYHSFPPNHRRKKFFDKLVLPDTDLLQLIDELSRPRRIEIIKRNIKKIIRKFYGKQK